MILELPGCSVSPNNISVKYASFVFLKVRNALEKLSSDKMAVSLFNLWFYFSFLTISLLLSYFGNHLQSYFVTIDEVKSGGMHCDFCFQYL